jgi:hypothetical protein
MSTKVFILPPPVYINLADLYISVKKRTGKAFIFPDFFRPVGPPPKKTLTRILQERILNSKFKIQMAYLRNSESNREKKQRFFLPASAEKSKNERQF